MKTTAITTLFTLAACALAAAPFGVAASAEAAPAGAGSVQDTVNDLKAQGYEVIVHRVGDAPLDQCRLTSVRNGQAVTQPGTSRQSGSDPSQVVRYTTIYVDANC